VAVAVVDGLEVVQVDERQDQPGAAAGVLEDGIGERPAVLHAGEGVHAGSPALLLRRRTPAVALPLDLLPPQPGGVDGRGAVDLHVA